MTYKEAVEHKKESLQNADESVLKLYHLVITPANTDESFKHIQAFLKNPDGFDDESCKKFSSEDNFQVVSFKKEEEEEKK